MGNSILFFKEVNGRLKQIKLNKIKGPQDEIEDGDNIVGKLDNRRHKKLWVLREKLLEEGKNIFEQNKIDIIFQEVSESFPSKENLDDIISQLAELNKLIEIVNDIFWFEIRKDFNLWTKPLIAVRKGWKIVWRKATEDTPEITKLLQVLASL